MKIEYDDEEFFQQYARMIEEAVKRNKSEKIAYRVCGLEEYDYPEERWDCVVSNLALHYISDLHSVYENVYRTLRFGGTFLFNIEHPVFTAGVGQDWIRDDEGKTYFLGCEVMKQHHTLTQILNGLLLCGFVLEAVEEAQPSEDIRREKFQQCLKKKIIICGSCMNWSAC